MGNVTVGAIAKPVPNFLTSTPLLASISRFAPSWSTSIIFSAWNAATYVNQVNDIDILEAEKNKDYDKIVRKIVQQNKGLWFNNELLRIVRK